MTATKVVSRPSEENMDESMDAEEVKSEEDEHVETTLSELIEVLNEVDTPGSTCAAGLATCPPSVPGLHVEGVGDIPLPISDAQVKFLASVLEQAPYGKGMETISISLFAIPYRSTHQRIRFRIQPVTLVLRS